MQCKTCNFITSLTFSKLVSSNVSKQHQRAFSTPKALLTVTRADESNLLNFLGSAKISLSLAFTNNHVCISRRESCKLLGNPVAKLRKKRSPPATACVFIEYLCFLQK